MSSTLETLKKVYDRVEQTVAETVGSANKTELSADLLCRINMVDDIKNHVTSMLAALEKHIPHDERLISSFSACTHSAYSVAHAMRDFARAIENWPRNDRNEYIVQMFLCAEEVFKTLSNSEKVFVENTAIHFLSPMKLFLNADMKKFEYERKTLMTSRVDMDHARNKATKANNEQNVLEATRATAEFTKQKELVGSLSTDLKYVRVEEEIHNMEKKLVVVRRSLSTFIDDLATHLSTSLEAVRKMQLMMKKQLEHDEATHSSKGTSLSLPDVYRFQAINPVVHDY